MVIEDLYYVMMDQFTWWNLSFALVALFVIIANIYYFAKMKAFYSRIDSKLRSLERELKKFQ